MSSLDHVGLTVGDLPEYAFRGVMLRGDGYRIELLERAGSTAGPRLVELLDRTPAKVPS